MLKKCTEINKLRAIGSNYGIFVVELKGILDEEEILCIKQF